MVFPRRRCALILPVAVTMVAGTAGSAQATEGYFQYGYGIVSKSPAGAGGLSYRLGDGSTAFLGAGFFAPSSDVSGPNPQSPGQNIELEMHRFEVSFAVAWRFRAMDVTQWPAPGAAAADVHRAGHDPRRFLIWVNDGIRRFNQQSNPSSVITTGDGRDGADRPIDAPSRGKILRPVSAGPRA